MTEKGTVKWFDNTKGYGFIERQDKTDIFVHYKAVNVAGFKTLTPGMIVEFEAVPGRKGQQADKVRVVS